MLKIRNLKIKLGKNLLYAKKDLSFYPGKLHFIKGESGSGKTSLLYVLGLISSQQGYDYYYFNHKITSQSQKERIKKNDIGFLYQNFNLPGHFTLFQILEMFAYMNHSKITKKKCRKLLSVVRLDMKLNRNFDSLSGGEKQRFCLACILAKNPTIIIADEPTSALDARNAQSLMEVFKYLAKEEHKIVILSTHTSEFDDMADFIYAINDGEITPLKSNRNPLEDYPRPKPGKKKRKTLSLAFYKKMMIHQLKYRLKNYWVQILLSITILSLSIFLIGYTQSNEDEYENLLSEVLQNEVFMDTKNTPLQEQDLKILSSMNGIEAIYPIYQTYGTVTLNDGKKYDVEIFPIYPFQKKQENGAYCTSLFYNYLNQKIQVNVFSEMKEYPLVDLVGNNKAAFYSSTSSNAIFIPYEDFNQEQTIFTNKYLIEIEDLLFYEDIKNQVELMYDQCSIQSSYMQIQTLLDSVENNKVYVYMSVIILTIISFILLWLVQSHEAIDKRKLLSIFQANGSSKKDLVIMESILIVLTSIFYLSICILELGIIIYISNHFILMSDISFNSHIIKPLLFFFTLDILIPNMISMIVVIQSQIEKVLRENI